MLVIVWMAPLSLGLRLREDSQIDFFLEKRPLDTWREGVLPHDVSPTPKNIDFLPLLVSKIYHTLPLYLFFSFLTLMSETDSRVGLGKYSSYFVGGATRAWHVCWTRI